MRKIATPRLLNPLKPELYESLFALLTALFEVSKLKRYVILAPTLQTTTIETQ